MREINDNPHKGTIEFIHQEMDVVVKRCELSDLPNPLPPEYRLPVFEKAKNFFTEPHPDASHTGSIKVMVFQLHWNGQKRRAYFFDRMEQR